MLRAAAVCAPINMEESGIALCDAYRIRRNRVAVARKVSFVDGHRVRQSRRDRRIVVDRDGQRTGRGIGRRGAVDHLIIQDNRGVILAVGNCMKHRLKQREDVVAVAVIETSIHNDLEDVAAAH